MVKAQRGWVLNSRHFWRRTARWKQRRLKSHGIDAVVAPASRGPYRWEVRELVR